MIVVSKFLGGGSRLEQFLFASRHVVRFGNGLPVKVVDSATYLGCLLTPEIDINKEVPGKIVAAAMVWRRLREFSGFEEIARLNRSCVSTMRSLVLNFCTP